MLVALLLCEEESGNLGELSDGGRVCVGDHVAKIVERVVQVVHPAALAGVNAERHGGRGRVMVLIAICSLVKYCLWMGNCNKFAADTVLICSLWIRVEVSVLFDFISSFQPLL